MSTAEDTTPFHEDFSWLPDSIKHNIDARFAAQVRTIVSGCNTIGNITQQYLLDLSANQRTLLPESDMYNLVALISPLTSLLDDTAESQISRIDSEVRKGAGK